MLITSTIDPLSTSDGHLPVSIFSYKDEKRFLRVSDSYEEIIERVVNSFQIRRDQAVLLRTSCFTACRGEPVVIDSSAYPLLWSILEEVEVIVVATESVLEKDEAPKASSEAVIPFPTPTSPVAGPSRDGLGAQIQDVRPTPSPTNASEDELQSEGEMPTAAPKAPPRSESLFQWNDEIQQEEEEHVEQALPLQPEKKFKAASSSSTRIGPDPVPVIKKEKQRETGPSASSKLESIPSKKAVYSVIDDDTRFDVVIVGPDEDDPTEFKLRGKNSVRKVLIAACRNFEIDPNRASLVHSMELEVDGELQTHDFVCPLDDTIAMCGIKAGSQLFVKVDPVSEPDEVDCVSD